MALVNAKCVNCGANLKVNNHSKTGVCEHCGASYITEEVINITNINYTEVVDGSEINRVAVLEKMLVEYYAGRFKDVDNLKEYALKVQECDINNPLAHFVAFEDIGSSANVKKLLAKSGLKISLELFVSLMNLCDDVNDLKIIKNMKQYSKADAKDVVRYVIDNCKNKDVNFILNLMHVLKMSEDDNTVILEELYNNKKINKLTLLSELKAFASNNSGFKYNTIKFDEYSAHWNKVKNKQTSMNQQAMEKYNAELEQEKNSKKTKVSKKGKLVPILVAAFCVVMAAIAVVCFVI